jgi:hypothetical protein
LERARIINYIVILAQFIIAFLRILALSIETIILLHIFEELAKKIGDKDNGLRKRGI